MDEFFKNMSFDFLALSNESNRVTSDFDLNVSVKVDRKTLVSAAVLIIIRLSQSSPTVVFTKRAWALKNHPGQISFPGGRVDKTDENALSTALREAEEEVGLNKKKVTILGRLPSHQTGTGFKVAPFVSAVDESSQFWPNSREVDEIFEVPLDFLLNKKNMKVQKLMINRKEKRYYTIPYGPYYIWGATAHMIKTFSDRSRVDGN